MVCYSVEKDTVTDTHTHQSKTCTGGGSVLPPHSCLPFSHHSLNDLNPLSDLRPGVCTRGSGVQRPNHPLFLSLLSLLQVSHYTKPPPPFFLSLSFFPLFLSCPCFPVPYEINRRSEAVFVSVLMEHVPLNCRSIVSFNGSIC